MFAVICSGGKQYRVSAGDVLVLEKIDAEEGSSIDFKDVLLVDGDGKTDIGAPNVEGAVVRADVLAQTRGEKIVSFKRRRRKASSKRLRGHRQLLTRVKITEVSLAGAVDALTPPSVADVEREASDSSPEGGDETMTAVSPQVRKSDEEE